MPRTPSGEYELPAGQPVAPDTIISSDVHNDLANDLAAALTDSLSRTGKGGMLAPFLAPDGSDSAPSYSFTNAQTTGLWRSQLDSSLNLSISSTNAAKFTLAGEVTFFGKAPMLNNTRLDNKDLNELTVGGSYNIGDSPSNSPEGIDNFSLLVSSDGNDHLWQMAVEQSNAEPFVRTATFDGSTWAFTPWVSVSGKVTITQEYVVGEEGQTVVNIEYTVGTIIVSVNGYHINDQVQDGVYFVATDGQTVTIYGTEVGDEIMVIRFGAFEVADTYTRADADAKFVDVAGDTMTGQLKGITPVDDDDLVRKDYVDNQATRENLIINGGMQVWQRGLTLGTGGFLADRWYANVAGGSITQSYAETSTYPAWEAAGVNQTLNIGVDSGVTGHNVRTRLEKVGTASGETVTLSCYVESTIARTFNLGINQRFGQGGSPVVELLSPDIIYDTPNVPMKISHTFDLPSIVGKTIGPNSSLEIVVAPTVDATAFVWDLAHVKLELGDTVTSFVYENYALERSKCARFYEVTDTSHKWDPPIPTGVTFGFWLQCHPKRVIPTCTIKAYSASHIINPTLINAKGYGCLLNCGTDDPNSVNRDISLIVTFDAEI